MTGCHSSLEPVQSSFRALEGEGSLKSLEKIWIDVHRKLPFWKLSVTNVHTFVFAALMRATWRIPSVWKQTDSHAIKAAPQHLISHLSLPVNFVHYVILMYKYLPSSHLWEDPSCLFLLSSCETTVSIIWLKLVLVWRYQKSCSSWGGWSEGASTLVQSNYHLTRRVVLFLSLAISAWGSHSGGTQHCSSFFVSFYPTLCSFWGWRKTFFSLT